MVYTSLERVAKRLKTYDLRKYGNVRIISKLHRITTQRRPGPVPNENFVDTSKKLLKNKNLDFPALYYFI